MPNEGARIPRSIANFIPYIQTTDDRQLEVDPVTTNPRWQAYGWLLAESTAWTGFRDEADRLFALYDTKGLRRPNDTNDLHLLIQSVVDYERMHHLFDKIVIAAAPPVETADYQTFNIKRGTPLEDTTPTISDADMGKPGVLIKNVDTLQHILEVTPAPNGSKGVVNNIENVEVWRAIVAPGMAEAKDSDFVHVGYAKRKKFESTFTTEQKRSDAHYKARFVSTTGKVGLFSDVVIKTII